MTDRPYESSFIRPIRQLINREAPISLAFSTYKPRDKLAILNALSSAKTKQQVESIMKAHALSTEEIAAWRNGFEHGGIKGLTAKSIQHLKSRSMA